MQEFEIWKQQIDPQSICSRAREDSIFRPNFKQGEYVVYSVDRGRARLVNEIEMPEEIVQELDREMRERWSDQ